MTRTSALTYATVQKHPLTHFDIHVKRWVTAVDEQNCHITWSALFRAMAVKQHY